MIPTKDEARALLKKYNSDAFHLKHAEIFFRRYGIFCKQTRVFRRNRILGNRRAFARP